MAALPPFDQPSHGNINSGVDAFSVTNTGTGPAIRAQTNGGPFAIFAISNQTGVFGQSSSQKQNEAGVFGIGSSIGGTGVIGTSSIGVHGVTDNAGTTGDTVPKRGVGVWGEASNGYGVYGSCQKNGVAGYFQATGDGSNAGWFVGNVVATGTGLFGTTGVGVHGRTDNAGTTGDTVPKRGVGVWGEASNGYGVYGSCQKNGVAGYFQATGDGSNAGWFEGNVVATGTGLFGTTGVGVHGRTDNAGTTGDTVPKRGVGVWGEASNGYGVYASCQKNGVAGYFQATGDGSNAGWFVGDVTVTGNLLANDCILPGADCAEDFEITADTQIEPGTVMIVDQDGMLEKSQHAYDKHVAGVISGAGSFKPGIILGREKACANRLPVALVGRVYCKVDADYGRIEVGDLLTTSPTAGHAMKADDPIKAFGAVIGKALGPLNVGRGLIPMLVALQ